MDRMSNKTKIGKDVIESLTLAMYDDPRFIFREYIQNSADQIDIAFDNGIISTKEDCRIEITINKADRNISVFDNGTGVQSEKVLSVLKSIAQGVKDRTKHKGFRGIGRLGGLAYCDRLVFETSYEGENTKSRLVWNAKQLKEIINDRSRKEDAADVIDSITTLETLDAKKDERYFKVILENVSNDILLDKEEISDYLSMVAPVPYKKGFLFEKKIYEKAKSYDYIIDEYDLYLNNNQIFKEYTTSIYEGETHNKKRVDEIFDVEFIEVKDKYDNLICWGWHSISSFIKQIPSVNIARGIRLRKGNIQIGDEKQLVKLFKENRGSFYFFGEIYAVSPELIPNARRDYFTENKIFKLFEKQLKLQFVEFHDLYHFSSQTRSEKKKIEKLNSFKEEYKKKNDNGFTRPEEREEYDEKLQKVTEDANKAIEKIEKLKQKASTSQTKSKLVEKLTSDLETNTTENDNIDVNGLNNNKTPLLTDNLSSFSKKDRKLTGKILSIIDTILPKETSEMVKRKIIEELNK